MIRIGYVTVGSCMDKKLWSGTIYKLYEAISKDYAVENIQVPDSKMLNVILCFINKTYSLIKHNGGVRYSVFYAKIKGYQLSKQFKKSHFDILFAPIGSTLIAYLKCECPVIYLSDTTFNAMVDYYFFGLSKKRIFEGNKIERLALKKADCVVVPSRWAKNDVVSFYEISQEKCRMIPFGANLTYNGKSRKTIIGEQVINLLTVGVDWKRKGIQCAIDCLVYLNKKYQKRFKLTIIGVEKPADLEIKNVNFISFLNKNNKHDYSKLIEQYKFAHIFILPTRAECAGIVLAEACMFSLPIVSYDTGGVSTYVRNEINGYCLSMFFDFKNFAEKIIEIVETPGLYEKLSNGARKLYEDELNWDAWKKEFDKVIDNLTNK